MTTILWAIVVAGLLSIVYGLAASGLYSQAKRLREGLQA